MEQKLQIFRSIMELNEDTNSPEEFINNIKQDVLTTDAIYVYTPKGDVIELPAESTPVDFAYKVHTEVGNSIVGAIVNDNIVPLDYHLKTGDIIKINTSKASKGPNKDWLNFVVTTHAKNKIKSFYSKIEKNDIIDKGQELLEKELRKQDLPINETLNNKNLELIFNEFKIKDINDLYMDLGTNKYTPQAVIKIITKTNVEEDIKNRINNPTQFKQLGKNDILVEGLDDVKVNLSGCCKPIPGDNIIGYITKGSGISVHRTICRNIIDIDERLINVKWNNNINKKYFTDIIIHTSTEDNLLDIITKASTNNVIIDKIETINKSEYKIYSLTILIENTEKLQKFINDLDSLEFTIKVERVK